MTTATLTEADRLELLELYSRYSWGMDQGDAEVFRSIWAADASFRCEEIGLDRRSRDEITAYFEQGPGRAAPAPEVGGSVRLAGAPFFEVVDGQVHGYAEFVACRVNEGAIHIYAVGRYEDRFVKEDGGWRFQHRLMVTSPIRRAP